MSLFVLPHSTVPVERLSSMLKTTRNSTRGRLTVENLETCLLSFQASKSEAVNITSSMVQKYCTMWKNLKIRAEDTLIEADGEEVGGKCLVFIILVTS